MKKCGRVYYELTEEERDELNDLIIDLQDYHDNFGISHTKETFQRIFEIISTTEDWIN